MTEHPFGYQTTAEDTHTLSGLTSSAMQGLSLGRLNSLSVSFTSFLKTIIAKTQSSSLPSANSYKLKQKSEISRQGEKSLSEKDQNEK